MATAHCKFCADFSGAKKSLAQSNFANMPKRVSLAAKTHVRATERRVASQNSTHTRASSVLA